MPGQSPRETPSAAASAATSRHIRANNAAFRRFGIAEVVRGESELAPALRGALSSRPAPGLALGSLPSAASLVLALVT